MRRPPTLLAVFLTLLNDRIGESLVFPLLPFLLGGFTDSGAVLGLLAGSYALAQFVANPLIGALSDRHGRRPVLAICVAGTVVGLGLFGGTLAVPWPAGSPWPLPLLFAGRLIDGFSGGFAATAGAVLADISPPEKRARAFGLIGVAFGIGFILGPALAGVLSRWGVTLPVWVAVAIAVVNLLAVLLLLPETHPQDQRRPLPRKRQLLPFLQLRGVLGHPQVGRLSLGFFLFFLAFNGATAVLVLYFKQRLGWGPGPATTAFLIVGVVATVVQGGLIGPLVQRFGERRLTLVGLGLVIAGCLLIPLARPPHAEGAVYAAVTLLAAGTGLVTPCLRSQVSRRLDDGGQGAALGSLQGLQSLGSVLGPVLMGLSYEHLGIASPFLLAAGLLAVVIVLSANGSLTHAAYGPDDRTPSPPMATAILPPELYLNRELAWVDFNQRVLAQAQDARTPLLEQAKFSAIFSNNLDEFFMVRVASLKSQVEAGIETLSIDGLTPLQQLQAVQTKLRPLLDEQQQHYRSHLKPRLADHGVHVLDHSQLNEAQKEWLSQHFRSAIFPVLTPLAVDPAHPFPFISNLSLNIAALIRDPDTGEQQFARVKVPQKNLPRFIKLPLDLATPATPAPVFVAVPLEQVVAFNLGLLFPGMTVEGHYFFRVTRDADLELRELEADDLMHALEEGLRKRRLGGEVVRLEVANEMPQDVIDLLMDGMAVEAEDLYRINGPLGLDDLFGLTGLPLPQLKDSPQQARVAAPLQRAQKSRLNDGSLKPEEFESIFDVLRRGDVLLHHPYDLFSASVEEFISQAAEDPDVLAIKMTLYRVSKDSRVISSLIAAAENGKQVMALVELKARFDEENNIQWARQLEQAGVHVVYGVIGLKTHTKITLVLRRERDELRHYVHVGTGNYNSKTSRLYTDLGLLSARPELGQDLVELFNYLTGFSKQQSFRRLLVAPVTLRAGMEALIQREIDHAREGRGGHVIAKMNSLVDPRLIHLLYEAARAGVQIDLIIRGICSLRPGLEGHSENVRVISIIGRFLEHSRVFWFANGGAAEVYLGSADWMGRNLDRRVEAVTPVDEPLLRERLEGLLHTYLADNRGAWDMQSDGRFVQRMPGDEEHNSQVELMTGWTAPQGRPGA